MILYLLKGARFIFIGRKAIWLLFAALPAILQSQNDTSQLYDHEVKPVEIQLLYSYYQQDGDHSPVTGGEGTEYLTDHVGKIIVNIPLRKFEFDVSAGIDQYTSASTDKIDPQTISSASIIDNRTYGNLSITRLQTERQSWGVNVGFSNEWDVTSISGGLQYSFLSKNGNRGLNVSAQVFNDRWSLIYPIEMRRRPDFPKGSDTRKVINLSATVSQVINKKINAALSFDVVYQSGILSTPFHRIYFSDHSETSIERLPRNRLKIPISLQINYYLNEWIIVRSFYRHYFDDFGINASTAQLEFPIKITPFLAVLPFYRYHLQSGAEYFKEKGMHFSTDEYFTSDFDLSGFNSHKYGLGLRYSPLSGLWSTKIPFVDKKQFIMNSIELRSAIYKRSDGLDSFIISLGMNFSLN